METFIEGLCSSVQEEWESFDWDPFFQEAKSHLTLNVNAALESLFLEKSAQLVGVGEDHGNVKQHRYFSNLNFNRCGVKSIALELESDLNKEISLYLKTGKESYLDAVFAWERKMSKMGYSVEGRYRTEDYGNIIRQAQRQNLEVKAIDISKKKRLLFPNFWFDRREKTMIKNFFKILKPCIFYIGQFHLSNLSEERDKLALHDFFAVYFLDHEDPSGVIEKSFVNALRKTQSSIPFILNLKGLDKFFLPFCLLPPEFIEGKFDFLIVI